MIHFALPFLQAVCFFASLRDDDKSHCVRLSSESWKKHGHCFQTVCGKMDDYVRAATLAVMLKSPGKWRQNSASFGKLMRYSRGILPSKV